MVSIFAKAGICLGNTQVHPQFFCKSNLQSTQKGRAATQMDRSSTSSEISFHGLPSKSKRPSIRKQMASSLSSKSIVLVFTKQPSAERYLASIFFANIFVNFQRILAAHQNTFRKVLESSRKTPVAKSYVSKVAGFYMNSHRMRFVKRCSQKGVHKILRKRPVSETLF